MARNNDQGFALNIGLGVCVAAGLARTIYLRFNPQETFVRELFAARTSLDHTLMKLEEARETIQHQKDSPLETGLAEKVPTAQKTIQMENAVVLLTVVVVGGQKRVKLTRIGLPRTKMSIRKVILKKRKCKYQTWDAIYEIKANTASKLMIRLFIG
jgi:hypothetical protein